MPVNGFSVGRDVTVDVIGPTGPVKFTLITQFSSKPVITENKIMGLDGICRYQLLPDAWEGSMELERADNKLDDYFADIEKQYYAGQNLSPGTITETITEPGGGISQYRYEQVQLKLEDAGEWAGDKSVKQKIMFYASRRKKVS
jgi:hypothetical protein